MLTKKLLLYSLLCFILILGADPFLQGKAANREELVIAAASSLTDVLSELAEKYEEAHPEIDILFNFGATGALQTQIEQGAPVDIFVGASIDNLKTLMKKDLVALGSFKVLCRNNLVMVVRPGLRFDKNSSFSSLTTPAIKRIAIGDPAYVPAGKYGMELLKKLNLDQLVQSKLIFASNVRQALAWVEAGEVDAALVYSTDVKTSNKVTMIAQAAPNLIDVHYGTVILKRTSKEGIAVDFIKFITGTVGQKKFQVYGFLPGGDG